MIEGMAPPSSTAVSPVVSLLVRVLTFICLMISIIILTTDTANYYFTFSANLFDVKIRFMDVYAYRYMIGSIVFGMLYTLLQAAFTIYQVSKGNRIAGDRLYQFDFYADKVISYLLATATGAGFGATIDLKSTFSGTASSVNNFFNKGAAAASILLLGFVFSAISSVFSSLALPKRWY